MLATGSSVMMMAESTKPQGQGVGGGGTKQKKKKKERKGSRMFCDGTSTPTRHHLLPSVRESKRDGTNERGAQHHCCAINQSPRNFARRARLHREREREGEDEGRKKKGEVSAPSSKPNVAASSHTCIHAMRGDATG